MSFFFFFFLQEFRISLNDNVFLCLCLCGFFFFFFFLKVLKDGLSTLNVPYSYGFAIILLTVLVKAVTFPLTKKQVLNTNSIISYSKNIIYIYIYIYIYFFFCLVI